MTRFDWESNIKTNILMLRMMGLWPKDDETYTLGLYMIYAALLLTLFLMGHLFSQAVNVYFVRDNLALVTGIVYLLLIEMTVIFKVYYLIINMRTLKQLLKILKTDMFQPRNSVQISEIEKSMWFWRFLYKSFLYLVICTNLYWLVYPLMDKPEERRLPFLAWYPFNTKISPAYEMTYIYQVTSLSVISVVHVNIDALVAALNVFNGSQFDILCDNLRNLHELGENILINLINCIEHHKEILSYSDKSNNFLNWILFAQFFASSVSIGMTMFQLSMVVPMSNEFYPLACYMTAITVQIFMYCWFGNEVEIKSNSIPYAVFECDWTDFSEDIKKNLLFFALKAQRPVKLSALNVFYLSLDTFMKIFKTAWSYFALLKQVNS